MSPMSEMQELVTLAQAEAAIRAAAYGLPAAGLLVGGAVGAARRRLGSGLLVGLMVGAVGPLAWGMWRVYNAVIGRYGLDSVRGLLINLMLFVVMGAVVGLVIGYAVRHCRPGRREAPAGRT